MANVDIRIGNKDSAFFSANPTLILKDGQLIYNETTGDLFIGDGTTQLSSLVAINGGSGGSVDVNTIGAAINGATTATPNDTDLVMSVDSSVAKKNTWTQIKTFLKTYFDTIYAATSSLANYVTLGTIQTITAQKTFETSNNTPTIVATHTSGSGEVLRINKSGNGEGIVIYKLSGSGPAMSVYGASINLDALTASQILELDANKVVISAAKNSGYNLPLGTTAGTVLEGNALSGLNVVNLIRQEFTWTTGAQTFTLSETVSATYAVFVNGQELNQSQYTSTVTTLTILDDLDSGDKINIIYSNATLGINPSYTKAESDANFEPKNSNIQTKLGFITVTQAVDLDALESDTATNNAKVSNATHTGEVAGATTLTIDKTAITNKTTVTAATGDFVLITDASDSDNLKKVDVSDFLSGGGGLTEAQIRRIAYLNQV